MKNMCKHFLISFVLISSFVLAGLLQSCSSGEAGSSHGNEPGNEDVIRLGIIPLTDCAPLVIAHEKGLFKKYGVNVQISKEASWANVRDKLLTGELQGAHCLFGMPFSVYTGVGGNPGAEMHIAMMLNNNDQSITLAKDFCGKVKPHDISAVRQAVTALSA